MDCLKALRLIMPCLDGTLPRDEEESLAEHMVDCPACARQLELQRRLSGTLRQVGREEIQAPPELCGLVMDRVRDQHPGILHRLTFASFRRAIAVAASVLMLAGGLAGTNAGLKTFNSGKIIGYNTTSPEANLEPGNSDLTPADPTVGDTSPVPSIGGGNVPGNGLGGNAPEGGIAPITAPGAKTGGTTVPSITGEQVLLSSEMKINSTVLKLKVDYLAGAKSKVLKLANGAGTAAQVFPEQKGDQSILFIKITVADDQADGLIAGLTALGTLTDRQDESRDITYVYNETLVHYYDLQYRISTEANAATRQQLEAQAASYKQQLDTWVEEANKRVISLWLESN